MKTWQLFKSWLKIVKIARNDKVYINSVKQKLCDNDVSLQMSQFDNLTNMFNAKILFWYIALIAVGTLAMVFQLSTTSSYYYHDSLSDILMYACLNLIIVVGLMPLYNVFIKNDWFLVAIRCYIIVSIMLFIGALTSVHIYVNIIVFVINYIYMFLLERNIENVLDMTKLNTSLNKLLNK